MLKLLEKLLWIIFAAGLVVVLVWSWLDDLTMPIWLPLGMGIYTCLLGVYYIIKKWRNKY